jgi:hypothetical protein
MRLPLSIIPDEIIAKYNLQAISVGSWVYLEIRKGMYGLKKTTNYYDKKWNLMDTTLLVAPLDHDYIDQGPYHSHLLWMTLQ